jgi:hypothetical protein
VGPTVATYRYCVDAARALRLVESFTAERRLLNTITLSQVGAPVTILPPPEDEVVDFEPPPPSP